MTLFVASSSIETFKTSINVRISIIIYFRICLYIQYYILHFRNINLRAALIHVIGDLIQSCGVLLAAVIIKIYVSRFVYNKK